MRVDGLAAHLPDVHTHISSLATVLAAERSGTWSGAINSYISASLHQPLFILSCPTLQFCTSLQPNLLLAGVRGESQVRLSHQYFLLGLIRIGTYVDGLDVVTEKLLDLLTLNRGVDNNIVTNDQLVPPENGSR
jgi:hypothetical protein